MNRFRFGFNLLLLVPIFVGCESKPMVSLPTPDPLAQATTYPKVPVATPNPDDKSIDLLEAAAAKDSLSYNGYDLVKLSKKVNVDNDPVLTEVSYAILKKQGKKIAKFDAVYSGVGNATDFGLFSFLGGEPKQLFVSQTIPRGGRHWVASLSPNFHIIYDSRDWGVGRDDFIVDDIDEDGAFEILQEVTAFYGFADMAPAVTPLPEIIFKYNKTERKFLPANKMFRAYALKGIEKQIEDLPKDEKRFSSVLDITLQYIFVGEDQKGWDIFEREYTRPDKGKMKRGIVEKLNSQPVYKYLHRR